LGVHLRENEAPKMREIESTYADNFSITRGGPLHWIMVRLGNAGDERQRVIRRALATAIITWLPLLILSLIKGDAYGSHVRIPFLKDIAVNVRLLIAAPIMILAESGVDKRWHVLVLQFLKSGLVGEKELPAFEAVIQRTMRLRDRVLPEALMLVASFLPVFFIRTELLMSNISSWHSQGAGHGDISMAGWWFNLVSTPIFRFLMLRWMWRMLLWAIFLWRVSRINLYLVATHTDLAAGLGFLSEGQKAFSPIVFAGGAVIAAQVGNTITYLGATLSSQKFPMIAYGVIAVLCLVVPLLVVTPVLLKVKRKALREYGALVTIHNQQFDQKWVRQEHLPDELILGSPDVSSLNDLGDSFTVVRQMGIVPIDKPTLLTLAISAVLPMIPVILYATPADELIRLVLKMLG
jgi:hypothetical protein